jgi:quinol monooxygenase YgiN
MVVISGTIPIKPEHREEARQLALQMATATRAEAGCLTYCFYSDLAEPNTFFIFEEWESEEALARHFQTEHMKNFQQQAPRLLAGKVSAKKYTVTSATPL